MIVQFQYNVSIAKKFDSSIHNKSVVIAKQLSKLDGVHRLFVRVNCIIIETPTLSPDKWIAIGATWSEATMREFAGRRLGATVDAGKQPSWDVALNQERVAAELYYEELSDVLKTDDLFHGEGMLAFNELPLWLREGEIILKK